METIVEILELVGLVLVAIWIGKHILGLKHGGCGCGGASGPDLAFSSPSTMGCS